MLDSELRLTITPISSLDFTPLGIPAFNSKDASNDQVWINYEIQGAEPDSLLIRLKTDSKVLAEETLTNLAKQPGKRVWKWDGYDQNGFLDTQYLKDNRLTVELLAQYKGRTIRQSTQFSLAAAGPEWLDLLIDRNAQTIEVKLRLNLKDGGQNGVGEQAPTEVQKAYASSFGATSRFAPHNRLRSFGALKILVYQGVRQYWSRPVTSPAGKAYTLTARAEDAKQQTMDDIALVYNTNNSVIRSSNPSRVRGVLSLVGNIVARERIAYNVGWLENNGSWLERDVVHADKDFAHTAAHEIGHEILQAYGGDTYSYGHRGSANAITQTVKAVGNGGETFPSHGNIDLMKYYNGRYDTSLYTHSKASETDVKSLVYLARLRIR